MSDVDDWSQDDPKNNDYSNNELTIETTSEIIDNFLNNDAENVITIDFTLEATKELIYRTPFGDSYTWKKRFQINNIYLQVEQPSAFDKNKKHLVQENITWIYNNLPEFKKQILKEVRKFADDWG